MFCSESTIKAKVLKIFSALLLINVNLTRPQTTKFALRFRRSISLNENENDFCWGCSHRHFSGFKLLYRLGVISVNKCLKIKNQESLHVDPWLGKRFFNVPQNCTSKRVSQSSRYSVYLWFYTSIIVHWRILNGNT